MFANPFSSEELHRRLSAVRQELVARRIEAAVFASPENVFYLTGLDHWGYFAPHLLIVPLDKQPALVTRAMERVSIAKQVAVAEFHGHADSETAADVAARVLAGYRLAGKRLGLEFWASGLNHGLASSLRTQLETDWIDVSRMVDRMRLVKSADEQALMRKAARIGGIAMAAALNAIGDGADEAEVAAHCLFAMINAGGQPPGFGPFIRPESRLWRRACDLGRWKVPAGREGFSGAVGLRLAVPRTVGKTGVPWRTQWA